MVRREPFGVWSSPVFSPFSILTAIAFGCSSGPGATASPQVGGSAAAGAGANPSTTAGASSVAGRQTFGGSSGSTGPLGIGGTGSSAGGSFAIGGGATGGTSASGAAGETGGSRGVGGAVATGGNLHSGGSSAAAATEGSFGGSKANGGTWSSGHYSSLEAGGSKSSGGTQSMGGTKASSATVVVGGAKATGGTSATGGTMQVGGTRATGGNSSTARTKFSVYIAGDSTVSTYTLTSSSKDQAGWGQMLQQDYDSSYVTVVNKAVGGMTARHFIQAGNLSAIIALLKSGDYFFVQFGTNDSNTTATYTIDGVSYPYFADANTDFKTYLQEYIDGATAKGATPVLVTPPPRNSAYCNGGRSMAGYAQAMLDLGKADNVAVVDLSMKAWTYLSAICPKPTDGTSENFFKVNSDNTIDGTHFQENGATKLASFVADGIAEAALGLDAYRVQ